MSTLEIAPDTPEVHAGSVVSFTDAGTGRRDTFTLVGPHEADPARGKLSIASPVARALLGHRAGDRVQVHTPRGLRQLCIVTVD